ncbi:MAG: hypothetical protein NTV39_04090 [Candidatus Saccharibacteria bacterium]|nr:hypothetical protein [Candidatus Saccharibacteria bacterium]
MGWWYVQSDLWSVISITAAVLTVVAIPYAAALWLYGHLAHGASYLKTQAIRQREQQIIAAKVAKNYVQQHLPNKNGKGDSNAL